MIGAIFKKKSQIVETGIYLKIGGAGSFLVNCVNCSIFLRFRKKSHQIVQKSNPLIEKIIKNIYIYILGGAGAPELSAYP